MLPRLNLFDKTGRSLPWDRHSIVVTAFGGSRQEWRSHSKKIGLPPVVEAPGGGATAEETGIAANSGSVCPGRFRFSSLYRWIYNATRSLERILLGQDIQAKG
ncbi:hypothetical protein [Geomesophilobacter sediminis]|uniref:Uncharacterized protein n=1 Tax=Geomesophilobacter sediminis TaxID=2798584 RepID=A0A8J7IW61_9BACT|nr:hypothetical protein [Geomesophilobacter sediminis]MBJ6723632.1 hypothetical protein [Geomesophilobacter sediminis]